MEQEFIDWATKELRDDFTVTKEAYGDQNKVFKLQSTESNYFLKIGKNLEKEKEHLIWLNNKQPVSKVLGFKTIGDTDALILSGLEGTNLKSAAQELGQEKIIEILVDALHQLHATDIHDCPFGTKSDGKVLVHGDACLPNFVVKDGRFSGYIDLEDMRVDDKEVDLAAAVWSLQYNFGPGFGIPFLKKYGVKNPTEEMVLSLHHQYEKMMAAWDLK